jgi:predicted O-methyltransferase YrrM
MSQQLWTDVDRYLTDLLVPSDRALEAALADCAAAGLPPIHVAPNQGKLLQLLAKIQAAKNILEIGTLGGYSTIWLARALPPTGRLITLEINPAHAEVARKNIARAGLSSLAEIRVGPALAALPKLAAEGVGPFDLIFIDADKPNNTEYFDWAVKLSRLGTLIIVDNVVRNGAVTNAASSDAAVQGTRRFLASLAATANVNATAIQTVGSKGYDGLVIAVVTAPQRDSA